MSRQGAKSWVDVGELETGMDENKLPASGELAGKEFTFYFDHHKQVMNYRFHDASSLTWHILDGTDKGKSATETYEAIRIAPDIYFVDFLKKNPPNVAISMALDLNSSRATVIQATAPDRKVASSSLVDRLGKGLDLSTMKVEIIHATINPPHPDTSVPPHSRTADLVGRRVQYAYSSQHAYEHIYLNEHFYTWHCLKGPEKGLADTDVCDYFKIAPDVYLFTWREKIIPTVGVVMVNLKEMRSNGKLFGPDLASGRAVNFTMGSKATLINVTKY
jgi:hypothetical protein